MQRKGCALADIRTEHHDCDVICPCSPYLRLGGRGLKYPTPGPRHFAIRAGRLSPHHIPEKQVSLAAASSGALILASATSMEARGYVDPADVRLLLPHGKPSRRSDENKRRK